MAEKQKCPDKIYLQACDKCYAKASDYQDGVTYCEDNIGHECEDPEAKDEEYVRLSCIKEAVKSLKEYGDRHYENFRHDGQTHAYACIDIVNRIFSELEEA